MLHAPDSRPLPFLRHSSIPGTLSAQWFNQLTAATFKQPPQLLPQAPPDGKHVGAQQRLFCSIDDARDSLSCLVSGKCSAVIASCGLGPVGDAKMEGNWREPGGSNFAEESRAEGRAREGEEFAVISDWDPTSPASWSGSENSERALRGELAAGPGEAGEVGSSVADKSRKQGRVVPLAEDEGQKIGRPPEPSAVPFVPRMEFRVGESMYSVLPEEPVLPAECKRLTRLDKGTFGGGQQARETGGANFPRGKFSIVSGTVSSVRGKNAVVLEGSNMTVCSQNGKSGGSWGEGSTPSAVDSNCCTESFRKRKSKKKLKNKVDEEQEHDFQPKDAAQKRAVEEFLFEMLPEESSLGVDVVRDVLGQCEGDVPKALETLLNMVSSSPDGITSPNEQQGIEAKGGPLQALLSAFSNLDPAKVVQVYQATEGDLELAANALLQADCQEDFASSPSGPSLQAAVTSPEQAEGHSSLRVLLSWLRGTFPSVDDDMLFEVLQANDFSYSKSVEFLLEGGLAPAEEGNVDAARVSTAVMQTLFKSQEKLTPPRSPLGSSDKSVDDWKLVKQKSPKEEKSGRFVRIEDEEGYDEYQSSRNVATQEWHKMNQCFQEAAYAYGRGERAYAGILSAQGKECQKRAREASDRASSHLFSVKNKHLVNNITIDLHAQHVKEAMALLKLHLKSLAPLVSVDTLTVITGHGNGQAKIRPAVCRYLEKKGIPWKDENAGCIMIDMRNVSCEDPVS